MCANDNDRTDGVNDDNAHDHYNINHYMMQMNILITMIMK